MVSKYLGYRYLWIDSLCIIQDDHQDWQRESGRMADVYSNADLVLGATSAAKVQPKEKVGAGSDAGRPALSLEAQHGRAVLQTAALPAL